MMQVLEINSTRIFICIDMCAAADGKTVDKGVHNLRPQASSNLREISIFRHICFEIAITSTQKQAKSIRAQSQNALPSFSTPYYHA